jgi:hypothetical protein
MQGQRYSGKNSLFGFTQTMLRPSVIIDGLSISYSGHLMLFYVRKQWTSTWLRSPENASKLLETSAPGSRSFNTAPNMWWVPSKLVVANDSDRWKMQACFLCARVWIVLAELQGLIRSACMTISPDSLAKFDLSFTVREQLPVGDGSTHSGTSG